MEEAKADKRCPVRRSHDLQDDGGCPDLLQYFLGDKSKWCAKSLQNSSSGFDSYILCQLGGRYYEILLMSGHRLMARMLDCLS